MPGHEENLSFIEVVNEEGKREFATVDQFTAMEKEGWTVDPRDAERLKEEKRLERRKAVEECVRKALI